MPTPDEIVDAIQAEDASSAGRLWIHPRFRTLLDQAGWSRPQRLLDPTVGGEMSKPGLTRWRRRARIALADDAGREVVFFLKQYVAPPPPARRAALRLCPDAGTLAGAEWCWMQRLAADGVGCAEPAALAERLAGGVEQASALLIAATPGISLEQWFARRVAGEDAHRRDVRRALPGLAALIARFHDRGYVHRDLYACHVFIDGAAALPAFRLIDLARVFKPRWLRQRWIVKDLAALHYSCPADRVTRTDRLRWLKLYRGVRRLGPVERRLIRRIESKAARIARHDRGRVPRAPAS
ncbi:MAG: hypothetical protein IT449_09740 [Phycisphaerales bacterium]|nr:hypothetical protein [Phycisphaerales bacterium]